MLYLNGHTKKRSTSWLKKLDKKPARDQNKDSLKEEINGKVVSYRQKNRITLWSTNR